MERGSDRLNVVCVCTHNRTRSVLAAALLGRHLSDAGVDADVISAGVTGAGEPATEETVMMLRARGIDVSDHRSRLATPDMVSAAQLVLTAEHGHVIQIVGRSPAAFPRTFTLPELVERSHRTDAAGGDIDGWLRRVNADRPAAFDYLDAPISEIDDPTGRPRRVWDAAFAEIDRLTGTIAERIAR